jgi:hypothetical protein
MAYDEGVAARVRGALEGRRNVAEKKMFGGIAFMVRGHMAIGVLNVGPKGFATEERLAGWVERARAFNRTLETK